MDADGSNLVKLTDNSVRTWTPTWSPDGPADCVSPNCSTNQLFTMNPALNPDGTSPTATQLTFPPGTNLLAHWGVLRVKGDV